MTRRWQWGIVMVFLGVAGVPGCQQACQRPWRAAEGLPTYSPYLPPPGPAALAPAPAAPGPLPPPPPVIGPDQTRSYEPPRVIPVTPEWQPSTGAGVRLAAPQTTPEPPRASASGTVPNPGPASGTTPQGSQTTPDGTQPAEPGKSPAGDQQAPSPPLPVGIPQFATVQDQVTAGLKPMLDGLDWLADNGYRTVLHVRQPGEDDTGARRQVELRGMKYRSLEMAPQTLTPKQVEAFNHAIADPALRPLFVYDEDGSLAGPLWYLYFRTAVHLPDAGARTRAGALGLNLDPKGNQQLMWLAVQKYLSDQK